MSILHIITLSVGFVFATIHATAQWFELYFYVPWLDIPMHLLGGVFITLTLLTFKSLGWLRGRLATPGFFVTCLGGLLILWELFGVIRFGGLKPYFISDTLGDIVFGILGCIIGAFIYSLIQKQSS